MAAIIGTTGSVDFAAGNTSEASIVEANVRRWSARIIRTSNDTTPFGATSNARTVIGGSLRLEGEIEGFLDDSTPFDPATFNDSTPTTPIATAFILYASNTGAGGTQRVKYSFAGFLTGISPSVRRGIVNTFTARFVSTGTITIALAA